MKRHLYQTTQGVQTWCPLEDRAGIIRHATPRFAQQLAYKYALSNAKAVCSILKENHGLQVTKSYVQNVVDWIGGIAEAKEHEWSYALPKLDSVVSTVVLNLDGADILMQEDGWREAMVGTASLYGLGGKRHHTIYLGTGTGTRTGMGTGTGTATGTGIGPGPDDCEDDEVLIDGECEIFDPDDEEGDL